MSRKRAYRQERMIRADRGRWIRLYTNVLHSRKAFMLSDYQFRAWVTLLCSADPATGRLPPTAKLAFDIRQTTHALELVIGDLINAHLIDVQRTPAGLVYSMHDWHDWQYRSDSDPTSAQRSKRYRERRKAARSSEDGEDRHACRHASVTHLESISSRESNRLDSQLSAGNLTSRTGGEGTTGGEAGSIEVGVTREHFGNDLDEVPL